MRPSVISRLNASRAAARGRAAALRAEAIVPAASGVGRKIGRQDAYWPAQLAVLATLLLYVALPGKLTLGPGWLIPGLEGVWLAGLVLTTPRGEKAVPPTRRRAGIALTALVSVANLISLFALVHFLLKGGKAGGHELILAGTEIWLTNVLVFALWFWQLDGGGPEPRARSAHRLPDFLFVQMSAPELAPPGWRPNFVDYLYTSFTNATAFSPTDTMPLTPWAKILMLIQSLASLITVGLLVSRAVNILG